MSSLKGIPFLSSERQLHVQLDFSQSIDNLRSEALASLVEQAFIVVVIDEGGSAERARGHGKVLRCPRTALWRFS